MGAFAKRWFVLGVVLGLFFTLSGCSGGKAKVKGTVFFNKKPLPGGQITFHGSKTTVMADIEPDGSYLIQNAPLGDVTITVKTMPFTEMMKRGGRLAPPKEIGQTKPPEGSGLDSGAKTPQGKYVRIPEKYAEPGKSGLKFTVKKGENEHDVELTP